MADGLKADLRGLKELIARFTDPQLVSELRSLVKNKGVLALVTQAIADNFTREGPGWKPLKPSTIRGSFSKGKRKWVDAGANIAINKNTGEITQARMILQRTGLLKKSVTTPGAQGNINRYEGTTLVWGTNLVYANIHNTGGVIKHPGTPNGFGRGIKIKPHNIPMPQREFLVIHPQWKQQINEFLTQLALRTILKFIKGKK